MAGGAGIIALVQKPSLGLAGLIVAALIVPLEFDTGTEVKLNVVTLSVPVLAGIWILEKAFQKEKLVASSRVHLPLWLFLMVGLLALLIGNVIWDPAVPKSDHFWLVQLAQWSIFAFSAVAFWLMGTWGHNRAILRDMCWLFLILGGGLAILGELPTMGGFIQSLTTLAFTRASFWTLLTAVACGQLLFNEELTKGQYIYLWVVLFAVFHYAFFRYRSAVSNWVGVTAAVGVLIWLRYPRLRVFAVIAFGVLLATGVLYDFAGGEQEWLLSGNSRLTLIKRVIEVTMRNPITGLGPASYRPYANASPLIYRQTLWINPTINSHNNYVDVFAHTGLLGLGFFLWFMGELGWLAWKLCQKHQQSFLGGYVNGMFAAWVSSMVLMLLLDWILPFVYNVGFPGFQASILIWLFWGGLINIENQSQGELGVQKR
jgi:O-antigen ligase